VGVATHGSPQYHSVCLADWQLCCPEIVRGDKRPDRCASPANRSSRGGVKIKALKFQLITASESASVTASESALVLASWSALGTAAGSW
jgi:hypothetical protein